MIFNVCSAIMEVQNNGIRCDWRRKWGTTVEHRSIRPVAWAKSSMRYAHVLLFFSSFYPEIRYNKIRQSNRKRRKRSVEIAVGAVSVYTG